MDKQALKAVLLLAALGADGAWANQGIVATDIKASGDAIARVLPTEAGDILVCGPGGPTSGSGTSVALARYRGNGVLDTRFAASNPSGVGAGKLVLESGFAVGPAADCAVHADGSYSVVTGRRFHRVSADGVADAAIESASRSVAMDNAVVGLFPQADNRLLVAGSGYLYSSSQQRALYVVSRLNSDLTLDTSYGTNGYGYLPFAAGQGSAYFAVPLAGGKLLLVGQRHAEGANGAPGIPKFELVQFTATGALDSSFGNGGVASTELAPVSSIPPIGVLPSTDGSQLLVFVAGNGAADSSPLRVLRFNLSTGALDSSFGNAGILTLPFNVRNDRIKPVRQPDGKLLIPLALSNNDAPHFAVLRLNADFSVDSGFGQNSSGVYIYPYFSSGFDLATAAALDARGRVLVGGSANKNTSDFALARLSADGLADVNFGDFGSATGNPAGMQEPPPATPVAGGFNPRTGVCFNRDYVSNALTIADLADPAIASISSTRGAIYSINDRTDFARPPTVSNGDRLTLSVTSNGGANSKRSVTLQFGGRIYTWEVTTAASASPCDDRTFDPGLTPVDDTPDAFAFTPQTGVEPGATVLSNEVTIAGVDGSVAITSTGASSGQYQINGGAFTNAAGTIKNGDRLRLRHTASTQFDANTTSGVIVGNFSARFSSNTRAAPAPSDTTPDAYSFPAQTGVEPGALVTSATAIIGGIDAAAPISVTGGDYAINGGAFTSANGSVLNGDSVVLRHTASMMFSTATTTTVSIGGVGASYTSTTHANNAPQDDTTPDPFVFVDQTGVPPGSVVSSNSVRIDGINAPTPISIVGGEYRIDDGAFTSAAGSLPNKGRMVQVRLTAPVAGTTASAVLTIGGVSDSFDVSSAASPGSHQAVLMDANNRTVTLGTNVGSLENVRLVTAPAGAPSDRRFPAGVFAFDIGGVPAGGSVRVTMQLPAGTLPDGYQKYGTEPGIAFDHYYSFLFDGTTGAQISGDTVTLTLLDNGRGDNDPTPGRISDPGGPTLSIAPTTSITAGGGSFGWMTLMGLLPFAWRRRRNGAR